MSDGEIREIREIREFREDCNAVEIRSRVMLSSGVSLYLNPLNPI
jgi:hypothetical protein